MVLHQLPLLHSQCFSAATVPPVFQCRTVPCICMSYSMEFELWRPAKDGANMTAAPTRATHLVCGVHREAVHTAFFKDHSVNRGVILVDSYL